MDDESTHVKPLQYLQTYGSYASNAPIYDSSFATLTRAESDLLMSAYGSEAGVMYMESLRAFITDTDPYITELIDKLAEGLTGGRHSQVSELTTAINVFSDERIGAFACSPPNFLEKFWSR